MERSWAAPSWEAAPGPALGGARRRGFSRGEPGALRGRILPTTRQLEPRLPHRPHRPQPLNWLERRDRGRREPALPPLTLKLRVEGPSTSLPQPRIPVCDSPFPGTLPFPQTTRTPLPGPAALPWAPGRPRESAVRGARPPGQSTGSGPGARPQGKARGRGDTRAEDVGAQAAFGKGGERAQRVGTVPSLCLGFV